MTYPLRFSSLCAGIALCLSSCATKSPQAAKPQSSPRAELKARAILMSRSNSQVNGEVFLTQVDGSTVVVEGVIKGLKMNSKHGFHVHEKGDCSSPDASSAGGHFNPVNSEHGACDSKHSHMGDLGNISTDDQGTATFKIIKKHAVLQNGGAGFLGKSLIVHDKEDDLKTQPTGNSGARIGCGVIQELP